MAEVHDKEAEYRLPYHPEEGLKKMLQFPVRDDDIIIVGYPRSGTNWMKEIASCVMFEGDTEKVRSLHLQQRIPYIEPYESDADGYYKKLGAMPSPRLLSTHLKLHKQPHDLQQGKGKILMMLRNPKDVVVSNYCMYNDLKIDPPATWEQAFNYYVNGSGEPYGRWFDFVNEWWDARNKLNIKFVYYEEAQKDIEGFLKDVAEFMGKALSDEAVGKIKTHTAFDYSKTNPNADPMMVVNMKHEDSCYSRKGKVGDWKNYFTVAQNEQFERVYRNTMKGVDLKIQYQI